MIEAVIFDMDGVLIDSEPLWRVSAAEVFARHGIDLEPDEFRQTTGMRVDKVVAYWERKLGVTIENHDHVASDWTIDVGRLVAEQGEPIPGVHDAIALVQQLGLRIGLATASDRYLVDATLKRLGLTETFETITTAEHLEHSKPHPQVYMNACESLSVSPIHAVAIEDSLRGAISAKAASMQVIAVPDRDEDTNRFSFCDVVLESLTQLTASHLS